MINTLQTFFHGGLVFFLMSCSTLKKEVNCTEEKLILGSSSFQARVSIYASEILTSKSIVIVPPTGGTNVIDRSYAKQFCQAGYHVSILNGWTDDEETKSDLEIHQHFYSGAQKAIELVLQEIRTPYVGLIGTSVGALHAAISTNSISRFNAAFLIVGGAPIAEVIVTSDQKAMADLKSTRRNRFGFKNDTENIKAIQQAFSLEPTRLGNTFKDKDIGMVVATEDGTVPTTTQFQLKEFYKPQLLITLNSSHFWAIFKTWAFHSNEIEKFFDQSSAKFLKNSSQLER